jgi:hypothetical protein
LVARGRWFSPGTPASSTTKTGRNEIAEILLKVALNTKNKIKNQIGKDTLLFEIWISRNVNIKYDMVYFW